MGFPIDDGTGNGKSARVNTENQLEVLSVSIPEDRHNNETHESVWSLPFQDIDPAGADDYFLYITNTGSKSLSITDIRASSTVAGSMQVRHVSGVAVFVVGTDVDPVSRFLGSNKALNAAVKTDTDITGLTDEGILFFMDFDTVNKLEHLRTSSNIIIPPGQAVALFWEEATGILTGVVSITELQSP